MNEFDPNAPADSGLGIYGLPHDPEQAAVVLLPVPFDATTSYGRGTADGPAAILRASEQVDLDDVEVGAPWRAGIALLDELAGARTAGEAARRAVARALAAGRPAELAAGDRREVDQRCAEVEEQVAGEVARWLDRGKLVGTIGGEHGVSYGAIAACAARHPGLGVLQIDAHADLRHAYQGFAHSHASIMDNVARRLPGVARIVQVGIRDLCAEERAGIDGSDGRIRAFFDAELAAERFAGASWGAQVERIVAALPPEVYISFDIDGLDPALCPHTGTPVPGGLGFHEASYLVGAVARSGRRVVGFDLVEVAPGGGGDEWDGNVGARLLYKLIGWSLRSRPAGQPRPA